VGGEKNKKKKKEERRRRELLFSFLAEINFSQKDKALFIV
jgi:hypothetical protein